MIKLVNMAYSKEDLKTIRDKIDMLTYLENRGVSFRESGISWVGLCPVHNERTPSFHLKPAAQTFRCFGCGISGDIFSLVQELEQLTFPGAVQLLAEEAGVQLKVNDDPHYKHRQRLITINRLAAEWYRYSYNRIPYDHPAKQNLADRELLEFSITDESIGFAPNSGLLPLLQKKGFTETELIESGIVIKTEQNSLRERFRNRLIWTIYDIQGKPIGFSARKIFDTDNGPKYLNSPQTAFYNKSKVLLGLSDAKKMISFTQQVFVVEGQTDVMALKAAGKQNTVASCGTAFGTDHANILLHLSALGKDADKFEIVFCFDGDEAGLKAAKNVFLKAPQIHLNSYVVKFVEPDGTPTDPCDYRKTYGDQQTIQFLDTTKVSLIEFILLEEKNVWNIKTPEGKSNYVTAAQKILEQVTNPIQHAAYLRKVAAWTGLSYTALQSWSKRPAQQLTKPQQTSVDTTEKFTVDGDIKEVSILAAIIQYPEETKQLVTQHKMDETFFVTQPELAKKLLSDLQQNEFDFADQATTFLSHYNLMITEERKSQALEHLFKTYLRHLYIQETQKLDTLLGDPNGTENPETVMFHMMEQQQFLKNKYLGNT